MNVLQRVAEAQRKLKEAGEAAHAARVAADAHAKVGS